MARRTRISLLSCVLALAVAGCGSGGDGTIPPGDADDLLSLLAAVEADVEVGNCDLAQSHAQEFVDSVNALPNEVDPKVAGELTEAGINLDQLAAEPGECTATGTSGELGDQSSTTTETVAPETTTEETTTEEPTTTLEEPEEQPSEQPNEEQPSSGDQGGGETGGGGAEPPSGGVGAGGNPG